MLYCPSWFVVSVNFDGAGLGPTQIDLVECGLLRGCPMLGSKPTGDGTDPVEQTAADRVEGVVDPEKDGFGFGFHGQSVGGWKIRTVVAAHSATLRC